MSEACLFTSAFHSFHSHWPQQMDLQWENHLSSPDRSTGPVQGCYSSGFLAFMIWLRCHEMRDETLSRAEGQLLIKGLPEDVLCNVLPSINKSGIRFFTFLVFCLKQLFSVVVM